MTSIPAIDRVREIARQKGDDFEAMLADYLRDGIVVSNPEAFIMARPITIEGRPVWFIKAAAGNLQLLVRMLPTFRPWVMFDRSKGHKRPRVYSSKRLLALVLATPKSS